MNIFKAAIEDVVIVIPEIFGDQRGFFKETWRDTWTKELGINGRFVQDNHSKSGLGVLRGLHYQIQHPQGKLVRALSGTIYDVAVDLRRGSTTFGKWVGEVLSAENHKMLWVPPGFAHGFLVMSEIAEIAYKCTDYYHPEFEKTLLWDDQDLDIGWPLKEAEILLSEKDRNGYQLKNAEVFESLP